MSKYEHLKGVQFTEKPAPIGASYHSSRGTVSTHYDDGSVVTRGFGDGFDEKGGRDEKGGGSKVPVKPKPKSPAGGAAMKVGS